MNPSSNIAPAFANSSAFSLPSVTNFSKCDISLLSFFVRCALTCSTSTKISFDIDSCSSSQFLDPRVSIASFWVDACRFSSPQPINNNSHVIDMHLHGFNHFIEKTEEGRQLHPLDGALDLKFSIHRAMHPVQKSQFFIKTAQSRPLPLLCQDAVPPWMWV